MEEGGRGEVGRRLRKAADSWFLARASASLIDASSTDSRARYSPPVPLPRRSPFPFPFPPYALGLNTCLTLSDTRERVYIFSISRSIRPIERSKYRSVRMRRVDLVVCVLVETPQLSTIIVLRTCACLLYT